MLSWEWQHYRSWFVSHAAIFVRGGATTQAAPIWAIWFYSASSCERTLGLHQCWEVSKQQSFQKQLFQKQQGYFRCFANYYFTECFADSQVLLVMTFFFNFFQIFAATEEAEMLRILLWTPIRSALSHRLYIGKSLSFRHLGAII